MAGGQSCVPVHAQCQRAGNTGFQCRTRELYCTLEQGYLALLLGDMADMASQKNVELQMLIPTKTAFSRCIFHLLRNSQCLSL